MMVVRYGDLKMGDYFTCEQVNGSDIFIKTGYKTCGASILSGILITFNNREIVKKVLGPIKILT